MTDEQHKEIHEKMSSFFDVETRTLSPKACAVVFGHIGTQEDQGTEKAAVMTFLVTPEHMHESPDAVALVGFAHSVAVDGVMLVRALLTPSHGEENAERTIRLEEVLAHLSEVIDRVDSANDSENDEVLVSRERMHAFMELVKREFRHGDEMLALVETLKTKIVSLHGEIDELRRESTGLAEALDHSEAKVDHLTK